MADEKRIMRGLSRRRQQEDMSHARLDILFLLLFPLFFLVFNLVYWLSFLYASCSNCDYDKVPAPPEVLVAAPEDEATLLEQGFIV